MIYISKDRQIHVVWSIFRGTSDVHEDFSRALVKVFLIGNYEKYLLEAVAEGGNLVFDIPQGLPEGAYSLEAIWVKNYNNLLPCSDTLTPSVDSGCRNQPLRWPFKHPHDHRFNDRCIMRSRKDFVFALTEYDSESTFYKDSGEAEIKIRSAVATYGYDGLSAYEIAVLRGDFNGTEGEYLDSLKFKLEVAQEHKLGGITAVTKTDDETEEVKVDPETGRLYVKPGGGSLSVATETKLGGIKASSKTDNETVEAKIGEDGKLYVPKGGEELKTATETTLGGIKAATKSSLETQEVKIDPATGKLYTQPGGEGGVEIVNNPDEEDLHSIEKSADVHVLQFADKEYNASSFSGIGRVYLRKNISGGKNVLTQAMMNKSNTRYIIQYDYDLDGETITMPEGCTLDFQGGSLQNGNIIGHDSGIKAELKKIFNSDITINGTYNIKDVYPEWFGAKGDDNNDDTISIQKAVDFARNYNCSVCLLNKTYKITSTLYIYNGSIIKGVNYAIGYWSGGGTIKQYGNVPCISIKSTSSRAIITGISLRNFTVEFANDLASLTESCIGIDISEDISRVKGIIIENVFVHNCYFGFKMYCYDTNDRAYSLNSWSRCSFMRNVVGVYFGGPSGNNNWLNLNSFRDCSFSENKEKGFVIRSFHSVQENQFYDCSFEQNGYNNEDNYIGIGFESQSNGGINTLYGCYLEYNVSKKLKDEFEVYTLDEKFYDSANVNIMGGTLRMVNCINAGSPHYVKVQYYGTSLILENNQYVKSLDLCCDKIVSIHYIQLDNSSLSSFKIHEPLVNPVTGVFNMLDDSDIRDSDVDVDIVTNGHKRLFLRYNSLNYFNYNEIIVDKDGPVNNFKLGLEKENAFNSIGGVIRGAQSFPTNEIKISLSSDITEPYYSSQVSDKTILINGNGKTLTINNGTLGSGSFLYKWDNCKVIIKNMNIVFSNTLKAFNLMTSNGNGEILFSDCSFDINTDKVNSFLTGYKKIVFDNCTFSGSTTGGNFYMESKHQSNIIFIDTDYPFRINYSWKGVTAKRPSGVEEGFEYYDSTLKKKVLWNGTDWVNLDGTAL